MSRGHVGPTLLPGERILGASGATQCRWPAGSTRGTRGDRGRRRGVTMDPPPPLF